MGIVTAFHTSREIGIAVSIHTQGSTHDGRRCGGLTEHSQQLEKTWKTEYFDYKKMAVG